MTAYLRATTLDEALAALAEHGGGARVIAGGTDLMVRVRAGTLAPEALVNVFRLEELGRIAVRARELEIGAAVTVAAILRSPELRQALPLLWHAADRFASPLVRSRATIGGNLCNASPAADLSLALLALDAEVVLASRAGRRVLPCERFVLGVGRTALAPGELVVSVIVPRSARDAVCFEKSGTRPGLEISLAALAFAAKLHEGRVLDVRIACGAVAPTPLRLRRAEELLLGRVLDAALGESCAVAAASEITPIDDVRASARYRRLLVAAYVRRALAALAAPGGRLHATGS